MSVATVTIHMTMLTVVTYRPGVASRQLLHDAAQALRTLGGSYGLAISTVVHFMIIQSVLCFMLLLRLPLLCRPGGGAAGGGIA